MNKNIFFDNDLFFFEISFILQSNFIIKKYTRRVYENKEVLLNTQENKKIIEDSEKMKENIIEYYQKEIINGIIFTIDGDCIVVRDGFVIIIENYKLKMEKNLNIFKDKIANNVLSVVENKIKKYLKMRLSLINFYEFFFNKSNKFNKYKEDKYAAVW